MALDPTIPLGIKPMQGPTMNDIVGMAGTAQNIRQSQQQTANLAAANPGIAAQSQVQQQQAVDAQRKAKAQQLTPEIMSNHMKTNEDGTQTLDIIGASNAFAKAGLPDQVTNILKPYMDQVSQNQDIVKKLQDNQGELYKVQLGVSAPMLNLVANEADPAKRAEILDRAKAGSSDAYPTLFPKGKTGVMDQLFEYAKVNPKGAASYAMNPAEWTKLDNQTRDSLTSEANMHIARTNADTDVLKQKLGVIGAVNELTGNIAVLDQASAAIDAKRGKDGKLPQDILALTGDKLAARLKSDPSLAAMQSGIERLKALGIPVDLNQGFEAVQRQIDLGSGIQKGAVSRIQAEQKAAGRGSGGGQVAPAAPTIGTGKPSVKAPAADTTGIEARRAEAKAVIARGADAAKVRAHFKKLTGQEL